jgi:hypothetical protein
MASDMLYVFCLSHCRVLNVNVSAAPTSHWASRHHRYQWEAFASRGRRGQWQGPNWIIWVAGQAIAAASKSILLCPLEQPQWGCNHSD